VFLESASFGGIREVLEKRKVFGKAQVVEKARSSK
jgi:hypothetical protein